MTKDQRKWLTMFIFSIGASIFIATMGSVLFSLPSFAMALIFGLLFIHTEDEDEHDEP